MGVARKWHFFTSDFGNLMFDPCLFFSYFLFDLLSSLHRVRYQQVLVYHIRLVKL